MSRFSHFFADLVKVTTEISDFVGAFLFAPFGVESPDGLNTFTAAFVVGALCYLSIRYNKDVTGTLRNRQANEFGLIRPRRNQSRR